jgi:ferrochelatase
VKTQVLLVNFGAPRTLDEVPVFLRNMMGTDMPEAMRKAVEERYRAIGGGSPLAAITEQQAESLYGATGGQWAITGAFRYSSPTIEERINECYASGIERIAFFPMTPYYNSRTVGAYIKTVERYLTFLPYHPRTPFIHSWYGDPLFIDSWARKIREETPVGGCHFLFSAHSLPLSLSAEPYKLQVEETVRLVAQALSLRDNYSLGWQSIPPSTDEPWIGPSVEAVIDGVAGRTGQLVEIPIGFVADHLETLYDIDILHRRYAEGKGLAFSRISSLNAYPPFIDALKAILEKGLGQER